MWCQNLKQEWLVDMWNCTESTTISVFFVDSAMRWMVSSGTFDTKFPWNKFAKIAKIEKWSFPKLESGVLGYKLRDVNLTYPIFHDLNPLESEFFRIQANPPNDPTYSVSQTIVFSSFIAYLHASLFFVTYLLWEINWFREAEQFFSKSVENFSRRQHAWTKEQVKNKR